MSSEKALSINNQITMINIAPPPFTQINKSYHQYEMQHYIKKIRKLM